MLNLLLIILGFAAIIAGGFLLFIGYEAGSFSSSAIAWLAIIGGALLLMLGFARRAGEVMEQVAEDHDELDQAHVEIPAMVRAMASVTTADGIVHERELATISQIYERMTGNKISEAEAKSFVTDLGSPSEVISELNAARTEISPSMKRSIVEAAYMVMISDLDLAKSEDRRVHQIGNALGFSDEEIDDITAAVTP